MSTSQDSAPGRRFGWESGDIEWVDEEGDGKASSSRMAITVKHLPGRHSQQTHGRGWNGGRGRRRDARGRFSRGGSGGDARPGSSGSARKLVSGRGGHASLPKPRLSDEENDALKIYTSFGHHSINTVLRTGVDLPNYHAISREEIIARLDSALEKATLDEPIEVWRGLGRGGHTEFDFTQLKPGALIVDKGFSSTSMDEEIAKGFARTGVRFKIEVPAGSRALAVEGTSDKEAEVILDRGSALRVKRVTGTLGNYVIEAILEQP